jgi:hypothetical protein
MVSPRQASIGALVGGPIALACFIRRNDLASGDSAAARRTLVMGILLVLAWNAVIALGVLMPSPFIPTVILSTAPFGLMIAAYRIARRQIELQRRDPIYCSNARVAGTTVLCLLASGACALAAIVIALVALLATSGFRT